MANQGDNKRHDATMPLTPPGARPSSSATDPLLGKKIDDRYELKLVLGEGGMGKVYLAEDTKLGRRVALKLMGASLTMDPEFRSRFEREAVLQANLPHPQIVQIIDMGETPEGAFIVMEYSDGRALSRLLRELGPLPLERSLDVVLQILEVLDFAHGQNVVHRDLKPANILVEERPGREIVRLLDFGIAKLISSDGGQEFAHTLTKQGFAYGTLGYMAPEQARGDIDKVDHRVDIYAVGIMLHEMLTGEIPAPPESRTHPVRYAMWVAENQIKPLAETHPELQVAEQVDQFLQKALRRDPDKRYQSAFAFRNAIKEFQQSASARTVAREVGPAIAPTEKVAPQQSAPARSGGMLGWLAAGVLAIAAGVASFMYIQEKDAGAAAKEDVATVRAAFGDMELPSEDLDEGIKGLKSRIAELKASAGAADPAERARIQGQLTTLREDLKAAESERDEARRDLGTKEQELASRNTELSTAKKDLEKSERELGAARSELEQLRNAENPDAEALRQARERVTELEGRVGTLDGQVSSLTKEKQALEQDKESLEEQVRNAATGGRASAELQKRLTAAEAERDRLKGERNQFQREKETAESRSGELSRDLEAQRQSTATAQRQLETMSGEMERIRKERDDLDRQVRDKSGEISRLKTENGQLRAQGGGGRQSAEVARLTREKAELNRLVQDANRRVRQLEDQIRRGGAGRPPVTVGPTTLTIRNGFNQPVRITKLTCMIQGRGATNLKLLEDPDITSAKTAQYGLPAGTTRVTVTYYRFDWRNRRFKRTPVQKTFNVKPPKSTVEIE